MADTGPLLSRHDKYEVILNKMATSETETSSGIEKINLSSLSSRFISPTFYSQEPSLFTDLAILKNGHPLSREEETEFWKAISVYILSSGSPVNIHSDIPQKLVALRAYEQFRMKDIPVLRAPQTQRLETTLVLTRPPEVSIDIEDTDHGQQTSSFFEGFPAHETEIGASTSDHESHMGRFQQDLFDTLKEKGLDYAEEKTKRQLAGGISAIRRQLKRAEKKRLSTILTVGKKGTLYKNGKKFRVKIPRTTVVQEFKKAQEKLKIIQFLKDYNTVVERFFLLKDVKELAQSHQRKLMHALGGGPLSYKSSIQCYLTALGEVATKIAVQKGTIVFSLPGFSSISDDVVHDIYEGMRRGDIREARRERMEYLEKHPPFNPYMKLPPIPVRIQQQPSLFAPSFQPESDETSALISVPRSFQTSVFRVAPLGTRAYSTVASSSYISPSSSEPYSLPSLEKAREKGVMLPLGFGLNYRERVQKILGNIGRHQSDKGSFYPFEGMTVQDKKAIVGLPLQHFQRPPGPTPSDKPYPHLRDQPSLPPPNGSFYIDGKRWGIKFNNPKLIGLAIAGYTLKEGSFQLFGSTSEKLRAAIHTLQDRIRHPRPWYDPRTYVRNDEEALTPYFHDARQLANQWIKEDPQHANVGRTMLRSLNQRDKDAILEWRVEGPWEKIVSSMSRSFQSQQKHFSKLLDQYVPHEKNVAQHVLGQLKAEFPDEALTHTCEARYHLARNQISSAKAAIDRAKDILKQQALVILRSNDETRIEGFYAQKHVFLDVEEKIYLADLHSKEKGNFQKKVHQLENFYNEQYSYDPQKTNRQMISIFSQGELKNERLVLTYREKLCAASDHSFEDDLALLKDYVRLSENQKAAKHLSVAFNRYGDISLTKAINSITHEFGLDRTEKIINPYVELNPNDTSTLFQAFQFYQAYENTQKTDVFAEKLETNIQSIFDKDGSSLSEFIKKVFIEVKTYRGNQILEAWKKDFDETTASSLDVLKNKAKELISCAELILSISPDNEMGQAFKEDGKKCVILAHEKEYHYLEQDLYDDGKRHDQKPDKNVIAEKMKNVLTALKNELKLLGDDSVVSIKEIDRRFRSIVLYQENSALNHLRDIGLQLFNSDKASSLDECISLSDQYIKGYEEFCENFSKQPGEAFKEEFTMVNQLQGKWILEKVLAIENEIASEIDDTKRSLLITQKDEYAAKLMSCGKYVSRELGIYFETQSLIILKKYTEAFELIRKEKLDIAAKIAAIGKADSKETSKLYHRRARLHELEENTLKQEFDEKDIEIPSEAISKLSAEKIRDLQFAVDTDTANIYAREDLANEYYRRMDLDQAEFHYRRVLDDAKQMTPVLQQEASLSLACIQDHRNAIHAGITADFLASTLIFLSDQKRHYPSSQWMQAIPKIPPGLATTYHLTRRHLLHAFASAANTRLHDRSREWITTSLGKYGLECLKEAKKILSFNQESVKVLSKLAFHFGPDVISLCLPCFESCFTVQGMRENRAKEFAFAALTGGVRLGVPAYQLIYPLVPEMQKTAVSVTQFLTRSKNLTEMVKEGVANAAPNAAYYAVGSVGLAAGFISFLDFYREHTGKRLWTNTPYVCMRHIAPAVQLGSTAISTTLLLTGGKLTAFAVGGIVVVGVGVAAWGGYNLYYYWWEGHADHEACYKNALLSYKDGDVQKALVEIEIACHEDEKNEHYQALKYFFRADLEKDQKQAIELYNESLNHEPDNIQVLSARASKYREQGDLEKALGDFQRCRALDSKGQAFDPVISQLEVEILVEQEKYEAIIVLCNEKLISNPQDTIYLYARGRAYQASGELTKAESDFKACSYLKPEEKQYEEIWKQVKVDLLIQDKKDKVAMREAMDICTTMVEGGEHADVWRLRRSTIAIGLDDQDAAKRDLLFLKDKGSVDEEIKFQAINQLAHLALDEKAVDMVDMYLDENEKLVSKILEDETLTERKRKIWQERETILQDFRNQSCFMRGVMLFNSGEYAKATITLQSLSQRIPENEAIKVMLCRAEAKQLILEKKIEAAIDKYSAGIVAFPAEHNFIYSRAQLYYQLGKTKIAAKELSRMLDVENLAEHLTLAGLNLLSKIRLSEGNFRLAKQHIALRKTLCQRRLSQEKLAKEDQEKYHAEMQEVEADLSLIRKQNGAIVSSVCVEALGASLSTLFNAVAAEKKMQREISSKRQDACFKACETVVDSTFMDTLHPHSAFDKELQKRTKTVSARKREKKIPVDGNSFLESSFSKMGKQKPSMSRVAW